MQIAGPTLTLRLPVRADAAALLALAADAEVTRWFSWGPYESIEEPEQYIERAVQRRALGVQLDLLVIDRERGPVGITGLSELSARDRRAIIGTWLGRQWWGTGVNAEAKALMAHLAFVVCDLERIGAYSDVTNVRSRRALEKLGMRHEGVLRGWHRHGDVQKDVDIHGLLRAEWAAGPLARVPVRVCGEVPEAFMPR